MNAALINGTKEYQPQYSHQATPPRRRERYYALLARVRRRQLDLAMTGKVTESVRYANRASLLIQHIIILDGVGQSVGPANTSNTESEVHMDEPVLECCGV